MLNLSNITSILTRTIGRGGLILSKHAPTLLVATGVAGLTTAGVMACKATLKVEEVVDTIHTAHEDLSALESVYKTKREYNKDMFMLKLTSVGKLTKLYGPALMLGTISAACIFGAHNMMVGRNAALGMLVKASEGAFNDYRKRLISDIGADKDRQYRYGVTPAATTEEITDEKGKVKNVKKEINVIDPNAKTTLYARFFDDGNRYWSKTPEYNLVFLKTKQNYCNDRLVARGHMFLNEVYDELGIPHSQAGAVVGWVISKDGDNFIDFGIYDLLSKENRNFVNGYEPTILLDFNVDGVIWDKI